MSRTELVQGYKLKVCIYRRGITGIPDWALMVLSNTGHSKVWADLFATEQAAWDEYQRMVEGQRVALILGMETNFDDSLDLNPALLKPLDQRLQDPVRLATYTLRQFEIIKKYSGAWPIKNTDGHNITGYLYAGVAPVWPHLPKRAPGAPANIDKEFTVSGKHIDFYIAHDRRLRQMLTRWYQ